MRSVLATVLSLNLLGCWELRPEARDPLRDAEHREPQVCPAKPQALPEWLFAPGTISSVAPLYLMRSARGSQDPHLYGVTLTLHPPPGVTSEDLSRWLNCHAVRSALHRPDEPAVTNDPYWVDGHIERVAVEFSDGATEVNLEVKDVAGAQELLRKAKAFLGAE